MTIITTGETYRMNELLGYETLKVRDLDHHFVYKVKNKLYDVYGKGYVHSIIITSIWAQRIQQDSLDLEGKVNCQRTHNQS